MTPKVHSFPLLENIDKVDRLTLAIAFLLIACGIIGFLTLSYTHQSDGLGEKIAYIENTQNSVKRKSISSLIWGQAQNQMDLFYGDEVMTSNDSSTSIIFLDQTILEVPENSLVRLTQTDDFIDINLIRGSFKIIAPEGDQKKIERSFRLIKSSGEIAPIVSNRPYTKNIEQIEVKTILQPAAPVTFEVEYQVPEAYQQQVILEKSNKSAQLIATSHTNEDQLEFVIYKENDNRPYQVFAYSPQGVQAQLSKAGHYYWEIRNKNRPPTQNRPEFEKMAKITVKKPILNHAKDLEKSISTQEAKNFVLPLLDNLSHLEGETLVIEVFRKDNLSKPIITEVKELGAHPLAIKIDAGAGEYIWKITPQNPDSLLAPTELIALKINDVPAIPVAPLLPDKLVLNYVKISGVDAYRIELPRQKYATKYYLEVFEDLELTKRVYRQLQDSHIFTWRTTRSGHYYYRYQFTDQWGRQSPISLRGDLFFPISPFVDF